MGSQSRRKDSDSYSPDRKHRRRHPHRVHTKESDSSSGERYRHRRKSHRSRRREEKEGRPRAEKRRYRFDSPPIEYTDRVRASGEEQGVSLIAFSTLLPSLRGSSADEVLAQISQFRSVHKEQVIRLEKKLCVSNLPLGLTKDQLLDAINRALEKLHLNQHIAGDSAIDAWIAPDGSLNRSLRLRRVPKC